MDDSAVTIEEEAETGYGATSSVPKVSGQLHIVQGSHLTPEHLVYRHFRKCSSYSLI